MEDRKRKEIWERNKLGIELRQKYELYFVSVAFTLAGLSVQTATHSGPLWRLLFEVTGWLFLSVAGLLGLWRISKLWLREVGVAECEKSICDNIPDHDLQSKMGTLESNIRCFGTVQYGLFLMGFAFTIVSRAAALLLNHCPNR